MSAGLEIAHTGAVAQASDTTRRSEDANAYLDRVRALLPAIRGRAVDTEQLGRIPDDSIAELSGAGVLSALQPAHWGGLELDPGTFFEGVLLIGAACPSTGWVSSVLGMHPWEVGCMHPDAQADVWRADGSSRISSSYAPTGSARLKGDGYWVSGRWGFSSGVDHCDWALLAAIVEGEEQFGPRVFLIHRNDFSIDHESWDVAGLAGTGSKAVDVAGVAVLPYRTHTMAEITDPTWKRPGWEINSSALYRHGFTDLFSWGIAGPALGAVTGFAEEWVRQSRDRIPAFGGPGVAEKPELQMRMADGLNRVGLLRRAMISSWRELHDAAVSGAEIDLAAQMQHRYLGSRTIADSLEAAIVMFATCGGGVMFRENPLQRYLRDLLAMRNHPVASLERFGSDQARFVLSSP